LSLIHFSCKCNYSILLHNKTPIYSAWGLLSVCADCLISRFNQSYELCSPWEQHLRYVPHWVRNGYNSVYSVTHSIFTSYSLLDGNFQVFQRGERVGGLAQHAMEKNMWVLIAVLVSVHTSRKVLQI